MEAEAFFQRIDHKLNEAIEAFFSGESQHTLTLDELGLRIRLTGPAWAGVVDKPVAKFLIDLDEMLSDEFKALGIPIPENSHGLVALEISDGSWEAVIKYSKEIFEGFSKLKPAQQILIAATVLAVVGVPFTDKIISSLNEPRVQEIKASADLKEEEIRSKERIELVKQVSTIRDQEHRLQTPVRGLINRMQDGDKIDLPGQPKPLKKEDVKQALSAANRVKTEQYYIDGPYKVDSLNTKDPDNWKIGLSFGDKAFSAEVLLSKEEMAKLLKDFQIAHSQNSAIAPKMHITAKVNPKGITSAKVVGLGEPRQNAVRLSQALADAKKSSKTAANP